MLIGRCYAPLVSWLVGKHRPGEALLAGISGAPGTGKSTLAAYLQLALETEQHWRVVVLSIDDFYLTRQQRQQLSERVHPLLLTRGVPGTHDIGMLSRCVGQLQTLESAESVSIPRFDKVLDDRAEPDTNPVVSGPIDLIILEGWCVGTLPQPNKALLTAVNSLEQEEDASGTWRRYVNQQLRTNYAELFARLDALIFLQAPNFAAVYRWRLQQEKKLACTGSGQATAIMNSEQMTHFIQHYERLTRANLESLPATADVVVEFDSNHQCLQLRYRSTHR